MSNKLLLANKYKKIGWIILIPSFVLGLCFTIGLFGDYEPSWLDSKMVSIFPSGSGDKKCFSLIHVNLTNTIVSSLVIIGALLVGFTKEKNENEYIAKMRLSAIRWAVLVNYISLLIAVILVYGDVFFNVMIYNMFTAILLFIIRYNYVLHRYLKSLPV